MLKMTRAAYHTIKDELSSISFFITLVSSLIMTAYLVYSAVVGNGERVINIVLCALTVVNFITYVMMRRTEKRAVKYARKWIKHICKIAKLSINAIWLGIIVYAAAVTPEQVSTISLVLLPLMIIFWVMQAVLEALTLYVSNRMELFINGLQLDFAPVITPIAKVKGIVGSVMGEEMEEDEPVSPHNERILRHRAEQDEAGKGERRREMLRRVLRRVTVRDDSRAEAREYAKRK